MNNRYVQSIFNARGHTKLWYSCLLASYYFTTAEQISHKRRRKIKHIWVCSHTIHSLDWSFSSVFLVKHFSLFQRSSLHTHTTYHTSYVGSLPNSAAEIFFQRIFGFSVKKHALWNEFVSHITLRKLWHYMTAYKEKALKLKFLVPSRQTKWCIKHFSVTPLWSL